MTQFVSKENLELYDSKLKEYIDNSFNNVEERYAYGIEWDTSNAKPYRVGNPMLHRTLPVQNAMRGCLLRDDGTVYKYLNPDSWEDEVTDGSLGQVMVEIPEFYIKYITNGTKRRVMISSIPLEGYQKNKKAYVGAYEATVQRSTKKLCSVKNSDPDYRGGNNNAEWDGTYRSLLGKPASQTTMNNFRQYAKNRGGRFTPYLYQFHKIIVWLYCIEYCNFNIQETYNPELTAEGYKQGGLGIGVTIDWNSWISFNDGYPIIPCGYSDPLGNSSGIRNIQILNEDGSVFRSRNIPRYRGIEHLYGHLGILADGLLFQQLSDDNTISIWKTDQIEYFGEKNIDLYNLLLTKIFVNGWVKDLIFGNDGDIINLETTDVSSFFYDMGRIPSNDSIQYIWSILNTSGSFTTDCGLFYQAPQMQWWSAKYDSTRLCYLPN